MTERNSESTFIPADDLSAGFSLRFFSNVIIDNYPARIYNIKKAALSGTAKKGKIMKKLLSILLALVFVFTAALPVFAESETTEAAIIVPGVGESMLLFEEGENKDRRFFDPVADYLKTEGTIGDLVGAALQATLFKKFDKLDEMLKKVDDEAAGALKMNPDGTSAVPLRPVVFSAAESSLAAIRNIGRWDDIDYGAMIALELEKHIGAENVFIFCYDWRLGPVEHAERLKNFIADVKSLTGVDKVNLYGNSYGCQVVAQYLYAFGGANDVSRVVFNAPAWTGTRLFKELMAGTEKEMNFNIVEGARLLMRFFGQEIYFEPLTKLIPDRVTQHIAFTLVKYTIDSYLLYSPGIWSCCATGDYEEMKAKLLDPEEDAEFIRLIDVPQYGVMTHIPEMLAQAEANGIFTAITMNDGTALMAGKKINGDGVVDAESASGGETVKIGKNFADGRTGIHVSPTGALDLTNAYLPDRTWVTTGQLHGQSYWDDMTAPLVSSLLLKGEPENVFADPAFPQFLDTHCPGDGVSLRLVGRVDKTLDPEAGSIKAVIRNDSEKYPTFIKGVTVRGIPYRISPAFGILAPGQEKTVTLKPTNRKGGSEYGSVIISYTVFGPFPLPRERSQAFKLA